MPVLPLNSVHSDLVTYSIKSNGSVLPPSVRILSFTVNRELNRIPYAVIKILDGDAAEQDFEVSSSDSFVPGNELEIQLGYHSEEESIFKGIVVKHALKLRNNKPSLLEIECKSSAVKLTTTKRSAVYQEMTDTDIISEIISRNSMAGDVSPTSVTHKEMLQYQATDWDFVQLRAEANGLVVSVKDDQIAVKSPADAANSGLGFTYGMDIFEFEAEMDARNQFPGSHSEAWDYSTQELIEEEGEESTLASPGNIDGLSLAEALGTDPFELSHSGKRNSAELKAWADARLQKSRLAKIRGRLRVTGNAALLPHLLINLQGLGARFNGDYYVSGVRHEFANGSWFTDVQLGLDPQIFSEKFTPAPANSTGILAAVNGLQTGVVSSLEDPEAEDRVLVKIPVIHQDEDAVWCRTALLDAGENRGSFFRPEIGDEVIVGFINDDPRDAVILGSLHSSAKPAPISATDDNHLKGIYTRSGMKLEFDDEKSSITVETPGGHKLLIDDDSGKMLMEDSSGNKIEMSSSGIVIESAGKLELKAATDLKLEGLNVQQKAQARFKAEGSASAELSSSGQTLVKGGVVMIN